jgi:hypothetical protein
MFCSPLRTLLGRLAPRRPRDRRPATPAPPICARDEPAYVLLETARLRCERLRARSGEQATEPERWFAQLHRELGLAGYFAGERIPSQQRLELLESARARAQGLRGAPGELHSLAALVDEAQGAVLGALHVPELSDHMQQAHERVLAALALLDERLRHARIAAPDRLAAGGR